ncbi:MAG: ComF family protein [Prevotella sp.]|jgi:ComF family protein
MNPTDNKVSLFCRRLVDTLAPRVCALCGRRLGLSEQLVCAGCNVAVARTHYAENPYDNDMAKLFWHLAPIQKAAALFFYSAGSPAAQAIYKLKYYGRPDIGFDLGRLLARELEANGFFKGIDLIVPVPLAPKRKRQRGYNQSEAIATGMARESGIRMDTKCFRRTSFTKSQTHLSRRERQENVADVFRIANAKRLQNRGVLLVDDVCTTGATLAACAKVLSSVPGITLSAATLAFAGMRFDDEMHKIDPDQLFTQI